MSSDDKWACDISSVMRRRKHLKSDDGRDAAEKQSEDDRAPTSAASRAICRYLKVSVRESDDMHALPAKGQARLIFLYLLTGPHTLGLHIPGLYSIGPQALKERLAMNGQQFTQAIAELQSVVGLQTDFPRCIIWLPSALTHMRPPANPNIVRSYCRGIQLAPKNEFREKAIQTYALFLASLGNCSLKPFTKCFSNHLETVPYRKRKRERSNHFCRHEHALRGFNSIP